MSNYEAYQNGLGYNHPIHRLECSKVQNISAISNFKKPFRCHICLFLFNFQVISTILMLISLSFTIEVISAKEYFVDTSMRNSSIDSGLNKSNNQVEHSFEEILFRFRRLSMNKTWILTKDSAKSVCSSGYYANRFKSLTKMRMANCGMFDASTVVYRFLIRPNDLITVSSNVTFPTYQYSVRVADEMISKLPSQLLTLAHTGEIRASLKSTQNHIVAHFSTPDDCAAVLARMLAVDDSVRDAVATFRDSLIKSHCDVTRKARLKSRIICSDCEKAYKEWLCTQSFDMFTSITLPNAKPTNSKSSFPIPNVPYENQSVLIGIKSCPVWCSKVETDCVFFTPANGNGGEPAFLCDESHYHHNARYRLNSNSDCGADLPWKFCCYSQSLLDKWQQRQLAVVVTNHSDDDCSKKQETYLIKIIQAVYDMKWSLSSQSSNKSDLSNHNCSPSLHRQHRQHLIIILLYFYTYFTIR